MIDRYGMSGYWWRRKKEGDIWKGGVKVLLGPMVNIPLWRESF